MSSIADQKNLFIELNGQGYKLTIGDVVIPVTPGEALGLFTSLLHTLPEIPDGVRTAHHIRYGPKAVLRKHWRQEDGVIKCDRFQIITYVDHRVVDRTKLHPSREEALKSAEERYGGPLEIVGEEESPGSERVARGKALQWKIEDYVKRKNITVQDLFREIQSGETEFDMEVSVVDLS